MQKKLVAAGIVILGLTTSVVVGVVGGTLALSNFSQYRDDSRFYNEKAFSLLDQGSFCDDTSEFRKPPVYSLFLAGAYGTLGRRPHSVWLLQAGLLILTILILLSISRIFFSGPLVYLMPLLFSLAWWELFYVFKIGSDLLAITLLAGGVLLTLRSLGKFSYRGAVAWGLLFAILILTKPVVLYAIPFLLAIAFWEQRRQGVVALLMIILLVGGWMARNQILFDDYQIEQTGHIVWVRGVFAQSSWHDFAAYSISAIAGDYVADLVFPGYALRPLPGEINGSVKRIWEEWRTAGKTDFEIDKEFLAQGVAMLRAHPVGSLVMSAPAFFELNAPSNHRGFPMTHFLTGTREHLPIVVKLGLIVLVRGVWFLFLAVVVYGMWDWGIVTDRRLMFLAVLLVYFNIMHALIIIPMETRYLAPVVPIYFFFFARGAGKASGLYRQKAHA
ncbi:MAG: hypothetical protein AAB417_00170 [Patescibacteria group bacterium]